MGYPNHPTYWWFEVFTHWLDVNGFLASKAAAFFSLATAAIFGRPRSSLSTSSL